MPKNERTVAELPTALTVLVEHIAQIERRQRRFYIALAILFGVDLVLIWVIA